MPITNGLLFAAKKSNARVNQISRRAFQRRRESNCVRWAAQFERRWCVHTQNFQNHHRMLPRLHIAQTLISRAERLIPIHADLWHQELRHYTGVCCAPVERRRPLKQIFLFFSFPVCVCASVRSALARALAAICASHVHSSAMNSPRRFFTAIIARN